MRISKPHVPNVNACQILGIRQTKTLSCHKNRSWFSWLEVPSTLVNCGTGLILVPCDSPTQLARNLHPTFFFKKKHLNDIFLLHWGMTRSRVWIGSTWTQTQTRLFSTYSVPLGQDFSDPDQYLLGLAGPWVLTGFFLV